MDETTKILESVRRLLRAELRVKVDAECVEELVGDESVDLIRHISVSIFLGDELIAKHDNFSVWPKKKQGST